MILPDQIIRALHSKYRLPTLGTVQPRLRESRFKSLAHHSLIDPTVKKASKKSQALSEAKDLGAGAM